MSFLLALLPILCLSSAFAKPADVKDDVPNEAYRLPQIYKTENYELNLTVPAEAFTTKSNEYTGIVTIQFSFTEVTDHVSLHAHYDFIKIDQLTFNNINLKKEDYNIDNVTNILTVNISSLEEVKINRTYELIIEFTGKLNTGEMYGFYRSSYVVGKNDTKYLATTQFEPTHARKAYPCFDEPSFKATFDVSITYPSKLNVLFNTPDIDKNENSTSGLTTKTFGTTPPLSTYLLAFIISEFTCSPGDKIDGVTFQVCSRNETFDTRNLAVGIGSKVIDTLNAFTNYNYNKSMAKMDQVAIPDFSAGAMENWGLVTYREAALLWHEEESSNRYAQRIVTVIAHELSHQWFGDLVTCQWWSEIFLNEGFATYFEYHIGNEVVDNWELDKQFLIEEVHTALVADALESSKPLQFDASTPTEISNRFDSISYNKGGSILRMVSHVVGQDKFKEGLQKYLSNREYNSAVPEDLWDALDEVTNFTFPTSSETLKQVMENWVKEAGFPLITVRRTDNNSATITQERFLLSGTEKNSTKWYVPISYTISNKVENINSTSPTVWLAPRFATVTVFFPENTTWILMNNQQTGYYRVNYDEQIWGEIKTALESESFSQIGELNRAQIVDDLFNLARANKIKYPFVFTTSSFLSKDESYYPWYAAFNGYDFLLRRVGENKLGKAISESVLGLMDHLYQSVPFSDLKREDQIYTHKQVLALTWACTLGNENCTKEADKHFQEYKKTNKRPDKNLRTIVYCSALRNSNDSSDWEFLWKAYLNANDLATEQVTILAALGCTKDTNLLKEYLNKTITDGSGIRSQDALSAYSSVYSNNPAGITVAFDFLKKNHNTIAEKYQSMNSLGSLVRGIAERFTKQSEVNELQDFISKEKLPEEFKIAAEEALETAKANLAWVKTFEKDLNKYYGISGAGTIGASLTITLIALFITKFFT